MKTFINKASVRGYLFDSSLRDGISKGSGKPYISGSIDVATDEEALNVVRVSVFAFDKYNNGNDNPTYQFLTEIMNAAGSDTFQQCGTNCTKVRVDGEIECNDYVNRNGDFVESKRIRARFVHPVRAGEALFIDPKRPATFEADMLIKNYVEREGSDGEQYIDLNGYVFNYRGDFLPVTFSVYTKAGIAYFEDNGVSPNQPMLTKVCGVIRTSVVKTQHESAEEMAFGEPVVTQSERSFRVWEVTSAGLAQDFGSDDVMTVEDVKAGLAAREQHIADVKARAAQRSAAPAAQPKRKAAPISDDEILF